MKKETDISHLANAMAMDQEKPMDPSVQQNVDDPQQFYGPNNDGQFGPMAPMHPFPLGGDPRQFQYRPAWNLPTSPRNDRPIDTDLLRQLADTYDLLRRCIEIRKYEICSLDWDIVPQEKNKRKSKEIREKNAALIDEIKAVFMYPEAYLEETPDGNFIRKPIRTFDEWLNALLEDYFVLDAMTIYPRPKRNGELLALERIDGATIKPLLTIDGCVPIPPAPAYQQYLYGMPRASFTLKQLYYKPRNVRNNSPYGFSHVEQALIHINFALRAQMWYTTYFTHGSIPEGLLTVPEKWTTDQMWEYIDRINAMLAGNQAAMRQFVPAPAGTDWIKLKDFSMNDSLISYIVTMTCAIMDIQPMELGFMPLHGGSGLGGKGWADAQNLIHNRKSLLPLARWLESIFTQIIHDWWGAYDLEFAFITLRDIEDKERDEMDIEMVKSGLKSIDEVVMERGGEPPGIGRIFVAGSNVYFEPDLIAGTQGGAASVTNPSQQPQSSGHDESEPKDQPQPNEHDESKQEEIAAGLEKLVRALLTKSNDDSSNDDNSDFTDWFLAFMAGLASRIRAGRIGVGQRDINALADELFNLMKNAYLDGLNQQLQNLGLPPADDITDPDILNQLEQTAWDTAQGIMDTLASYMQAQIDKLEAQGMKGKELAKELAQWLEDRADWKAKQISVTETNRAYTNAVADFMRKNNIYADAEYWVEPDECKCDHCQSLVEGNPYFGAEGLAILDMLPLHPHCIHQVTVKYGDSADGIDPENLWNGKR